jgi:hypothetical protein
MRGNQLSVVQEVLHAYLPTLETLAQQPSKHQSVAANLAAQGVSNQWDTSAPPE